MNGNQNICRGGRSALVQCMHQPYHLIWKAGPEWQQVEKGGGRPCGPPSTASQPLACTQPVFNINPAATANKSQFCRAASNAACHPLKPQEARPKLRCFFRVPF
eukprot:1139767-Pelagomonas_calceolata.AAC.5